MRKRRRSNGTWFPILSTERTVESEVFATTLRRARLTVNVDGLGGPVNGVIPITYDEPQESPNIDPNVEGLSEIIGNEYIIKRILGSCFVSRSNMDEPESRREAPGIVATAGFFVARAADDDTTTADNVPIGFGSVSHTNFANYSPQSAQAIREPWMWRRSWILGTNTSGPTTLGGTTDRDESIYGCYPQNNVNYPSAMTGPGVDVKSRRHVRQDERLYFGMSAWPITFAVANWDIATEVQFDLDIRLFGVLVKARARGSF